MSQTLAARTVVKRSRFLHWKKVLQPLTFLLDCVSLIPVEEEKYGSTEQTNTVTFLLSSIKWA